MPVDHSWKFPALRLAPENEEAHGPYGPWYSKLSFLVMLIKVDRINDVKNSGYHLEVSTLQLWLVVQ